MHTVCRQKSPICHISWSQNRSMIWYDMLMPPKLRCFWWRVSHDFNLCQANLFRRHIDQSGICTFCMEQRRKLPFLPWRSAPVKRLNAQRPRTAATQVVVALQAFTEGYPTGGLREFRVDEKLWDKWFFLIDSKSVTRLICQSPTKLSYNLGMQKGN